MDYPLFPRDWPTELARFLQDAYGSPHSITPLGGMSGAIVWRMLFADGSAVVKVSGKANEFRFYREVAPTLREHGISVPHLLWSGQERSAYWLALEDIPQALPRARWLADPEMLAMLHRLHTLDFATPPDLPLFRSQWTEEVNEATLSCFAPTIAAELRPRLQLLRAISTNLGSDCYISGDPNPLNWGLRENGTLALYDWERFGRGPAAFDLAITVPGLGSADDYRLVAARYLGEQGSAAQQLAAAIAVAKVWVVVEFLSDYAAGNAATGATAERVIGQIPDWVHTISFQ